MESNIPELVCKIVDNSVEMFNLSYYCNKDGRYDRKMTNKTSCMIALCLDLLKEFNKECDQLDMLANDFKEYFEHMDSKKAVLRHDLYRDESLHQFDNEKSATAILGRL